ncbi:MAG TPA: ribosome biogenesis GTPase Der [Acidimicrobiales bacterium]|nr:ribosome biogenesis GTPase Der [Acidimicrobiales bacterium]
MTTTTRRAAVIAIVGRPNVGKSTLVNRIVGKRVAIVEPRPGVTRDRKEFETTWRGMPLTVVDTGGWLPGGDALDAKVSAQSERAIGDADVVVMVVDALVGVTEEDARVANLLRTVERPVLLAVNKVDDTVHESAQWEFLSLGLGDPHAVSALHGRGTGDLLDSIVDAVPPRDEGDDDGDVANDVEIPQEDRIFSIAIVGRPNVGKSTLFNRLIGEDRSVVHDMPGTTRDSIDTVVETERGPIRFIDTAGMRRRGKVDEGTEYYSVLRALRSIDEADIALLVIDVTQGVTGQDQRLAERIDGAGCPMVVLLNKWELLDAEGRASITADLERKLYFIGTAPVLKISALTGKGVHKLLPALSTSIDDYSMRVPTRQVNRVIMNAQSATPAPHGARVLYAMQGATDPPTFTIFANRKLPDFYLRYLERMLREEFKMGSTPIKLRVRRRDA